MLAVCTSAASSQTSENDLRAQAQDALVATDFQAAQTLAEAALEQTPSDFDALLILAVSQVELGNNTAAVSTAARAYRIAPSNTTRVQAARLVANAHIRAGHFTRAEFWLRRAANNVQTDTEAEAVVREYAAVVQANPLSAQFNAAIFPTDNITGGSEDGIIRLESIGLTIVLPESQRALSGIGYSAGVNLSYKFHDTPEQIASIIASLSGRTYTLSSEAEDLLASSPDPTVRDVTGHDFRSASASVGLEMRDNALSPLGPLTLTLETGSYWNAGSRILEYHGLGLEQDIPVGERSLVNLAVFTRAQNALTPASAFTGETFLGPDGIVQEIVDATIQDVSATFAHRFESRDQVQFSLAYRYNDGGFENTFDEYRAGVSFGLDKPVFGTKLSGAFEIGTRDFDEFTTTLDGRRDRFASVTANATFSQVSYFGFSPGLSISAARTNSSAEENTTSTLQVRFGIASNF